MSRYLPPTLLCVALACWLAWLVAGIFTLKTCL